MTTEDDSVLKVTIKAVGLKRLAIVFVASTINGDLGLLIEMGTRVDDDQTIEAVTVDVDFNRPTSAFEPIVMSNE